MKDLTFDDLNTSSGAILFFMNNGSLCLDISLLTGDTFTGSTDEGVVETVFKLAKLCNLTQNNKNANISNTADRLNSFSNPFYSSVSDGNPPTIVGSITISATISLDVDNAVGL